MAPLPIFIFIHIADNLYTAQSLLRSGRLPDDITVGLRDPNVLDPLLPIVDQRIEAVELAS